MLATRMVLDCTKRWAKMQQADPKGFPNPWRLERS
jgi:hypothetical protein